MIHAVEIESSDGLVRYSAVMAEVPPSAFAGSIIVGIVESQLDTDVMNEIDNDLDEAEEARILLINCIPASVDTEQESDWGRSPQLVR